MLVFARNFLGTLLREATRGAPLPRPRCAFCGGSGKKFPACSCFLRGKFVAGNPDPKGVRRGERSRTSKRRRARDQHRASDRGRAGKKLEEWRSYRNCPQTGATAQDALQKTANDQILCLAAIQATGNQRINRTHTKPHPACSLPRDRARHGRPRRWYTATPFRCLHGKQLRNAPHGNTADPARHRWHGGASFRCRTISWTVAMRAPIQRMVISRTPGLRGSK